MGESFSKQKLIDAIVSNNEGELSKILQDNPSKVNLSLFNGNTNPICRASYLGK